MFYDLIRSFSEDTSNDVDENRYKNIGPLKYYINDNDSVLIFHVINVGQGLMVLIVFPDKTTMLFDCFLTNDTKEQILSDLSDYIPFRKNTNDHWEQWIDIFVNSHRDKDHYQGLKSINDNFKIKSIWDSGQYGTGASSQSSEYEYYMKLKREIKKEYGEESVPTIEPSNTPLKNFSNVKIYCLNSKEDFVEDSINNLLYSLNEFTIVESSSYLEKAELKKQHTNCIVLLLDYNGKRILLTGDSDWKSWKDSIVPNFKDYDLLKSDILIASHHGSRSFFTDEKMNKDIDIESNPETTYIEQIDYINPTITLISCGNYETYHHPNEAAVEIYKKYSSNEQVYDTKSENSSFTGFIKSDGYLGVTTSNFVEFKSDNNMEFDLVCKSERDGRIENISTGEKVLIGCKLTFTANKLKGIADNYINEDVRVTWQVSNSGRNDDEEHQEIYFMKKDKNKMCYTAEMSRDLMFDGIHMVRCTIENKKRNKKITKTFYVEGIK